jgi:multicomponent Na+:H+ antiporter subunit F
MVTNSLLVALGILVILTLLATVRVVTGPTLPDRLVAGDLAIALLTFVLAVAAALGGSEFYLDAALTAALLAFTSTVVLAKFIAEGRVLE